MTPIVCRIVHAQPAPYTAAPAVAFRPRISDGGDGRVQALALRCQIQIQARARRYAPDEQARLFELFGAPGEWTRHLGPVMWSHVSVVVPSFEGHTEID